MRENRREQTSPPESSVSAHQEPSEATEGTSPGEAAPARPGQPDPRSSHEVAGLDAFARFPFARFQEVRRRSEALAEPLSSEDCALQSMDDASPTKWHLGHTSWYFETFLLEPSAARPSSPYAAFDPSFRVLFNSYYNLVGDQHPRPLRGLLSRPSLERVRAYRAHVDRHMARWLERDLATTDADLFELGLHHEEQHQELILTDIKHALSSHPVPQIYRELASPPETTPKPLTWHRAEAGLHAIGHAGAGFGFDCERPRHKRWLEGFELGSRLVTSGEYLAFMEAGGYAQPELWLADGWAERCRRAWSAPLYWERHDDVWWERTLGGIRPVRLDLPVAHVSFYEADAFARWFGARLPDEAEWEIVARRAPVAGNLLPTADLAAAALQPRGVPAGWPGEHPAQLYGDVWEWTRSPYQPYPGFVPPTGAVGEYNGKFMSNQFVLRGGSCATPVSHIRPTYRNFFYPHQRWQFSGIRLARDAR